MFRAQGLGWNICSCIFRMGMKGKGRKRREANFKASHPEAANRLAPPPATKDVSAIPSKLRKIMKFKETGSMLGKWLLSPKS